VPPAHHLHAHRIAPAGTGLPFGSGTDRSRAPHRCDGEAQGADPAIFVTCAAAWLVLAVTLVHDNAYGLPAPLLVLDPILGALLCAALSWRRRIPLTLGIAAGLVMAVCTSAIAAVAVLLFSLAVHRGWLPAAGAATAGVALGTPYVVAFSPNAGEDPATIGVLSVLTLAVVVIGGSVTRTHRELGDALLTWTQEQHRRREQDLEANRQDERQHVAREAYDALAHRISLLVVHAGALHYRAQAAERGEAAPLSTTEVLATLGTMRTAIRHASEELREASSALGPTARISDTGPGRPISPHCRPYGS
jgi:signal transduction histidine kinase